MIKLPTKGYHGTDVRNVSRILHEGLQFPKPSFGNCGMTVWLALTIPDARGYGDAIFEVDFTGLRGGWYEDYDADGNLDIWQAHIFDEITPDRIELVEVEGYAKGAQFPYWRSEEQFADEYLIKPCTECGRFIHAIDCPAKEVRT